MYWSEKASNNIFLIDEKYFFWLKLHMYNNSVRLIHKDATIMCVLNKRN